MTQPSSWLELSRANLAHNFRQVGALCPSAACIPVIKANAYGAGAAGMAKELKDLGAGALAVATVEEGVELREQGISGGVVCLAPLALDDSEVVIEYGLTTTIFTDSAIKKLVSVGPGPVGVWVKVDTGLHRFGLEATSATDFLTRLSSERRIDIEAIFSTMIEDPEKDNGQAEQLLELRNAASELIDIPLSLASSYGILSRGGAPLLDVVRPGIMLHGFLPSSTDRLDSERARAADMRPIATWKTRVVQTRLVPSGDRVGYASGKGLNRETSVATLMIGWSDGYTRTITDGAGVLIRGHLCPVLSISANATMVDLGGVSDVTEGDEVVLVGRQGAAEIKATDLYPGGSVYRVFASIPARVPRVWE